MCRLAAVPLPQPPCHQRVPSFLRFLLPSSSSSFILLPHQRGSFLLTLVSVSRSVFVHFLKVLQGPLSSSAEPHRVSSSP